MALRMPATDTMVDSVVQGLVSHIADVVAEEEVYCIAVVGVADSDPAADVVAGEEVDDIAVAGVADSDPVARINHSVDASDFLCPP